MQITEKYSSLTALAVVIFIFSSCISGQEEQTEKKWCIQKIDSLWVSINKTKSNFVYDLDEFVNRKREMDSVLQILKVSPGESLSESEKSDILQYHSILSVYQRVAAQYKNGILRTENLFYELKVLEKLVNKGEYSGKLENFKSAYNPLAKEIAENLKETTEVTDAILTVEPAFNRLDDKVRATARKTLKQ